MIYSQIELNKITSHAILSNQENPIDLPTKRNSDKIQSERYKIIENVEKKGKLIQQILNTFTATRKTKWLYTRKGI